MKSIILIFLINILCLGVTQAQNNKCDVVFSKFNLQWFSAMRIGDGQKLKLAFKNTSDNVLKYVKVYYWAINAVGDIATDDLGRKEFSVNCTGPFKKNKSNKLEVEIALFHPNLLIAYPYKLEITCMGGEKTEIDISKSNLNSIFPNIEYIDIGNTENVNIKNTGTYEDDIYR